MTFRFKMRLPSAIVAHTYNCVGAFFSRLDETLAHCADDAEMSFVCTHINVSLANQHLDCANRKILRPPKTTLIEIHSGDFTGVKQRVTRLLQ
jgi:hypothetical protein